MVSISRELAARRAETAAKWQGNFAGWTPVFIMIGITAAGYILGGNWQEASFVGDAGLLLMQTEMRHAANKNEQRINNLRDDSIADSDRRVKEYNSVIHKVGHSLYRRLRGWS